MIRLAVRGGQKNGERFSLAQDTVRIGRQPENDVVLPDGIVSSEHLHIVWSTEGFLAIDRNSTNGTRILRAGTTIVLDESNGRRAPLFNGDVLELGAEGRGVFLEVRLGEDSVDATIFAVKKIEDVAPNAERSMERDAPRLKALYEAQKRVGSVTELPDLFAALADASLALVPQATHVTLVIREEESDDERARARGYVPVLTRSRAATGPLPGPIPITRSIFRKVVDERAMVLAADAPTEVASTESLMGAKIRSTLGVPLWRGEEILGVIQLDHRESAGMFTAADLDVMALFANAASLSLANARLLRKLRAAEERARKENVFLKGKEQERRTGARGDKAPNIIGDSAAMAKLLAQLDKVVDTKVTVLVEGETGVGKELVSASVHYRSRRRDKLFVGQNCAAMPENLLESELFGHKKGAFTGAHEDKRGLFEIADGGTLFLDEVTEMPLALQSKLLRALQEGEIRPVGSVHEKKVDVRIVAATNRNLEKEVAEGRFREDLYYRLKVFPLRVPPLRERREDIPLIAKHFLERFSAEMGKPCEGFAAETLDLLQTYAWPGNVRELQNEVQRLVIQVDPGAFITPELLSPRVRQVEGTLERIKPAKGTLKEQMDQVERWLLIEALREHGNNKTATAKTLGITREGLHKKLRQFGL